MTTTIHTILEEFRQLATSNRDLGDKFESQLPGHRPAVSIPSQKIMPLSHEFYLFLRLQKSYRQIKTHLHLCQAS